MVDAFKKQSGIPGPPTFVRGSRQIDAAWVTKDIDISKACFLPFYFGIGDHRGIILDIPRQSLVEGNLKSIHRPSARRLKCDKKEIWHKYNNKLEMYLRQHRIRDKLLVIPQTFHRCPKRCRKALTSIDDVITAGMKNAEKNCRKIYI